MSDAFPSSPIAGVAGLRDLLADALDALHVVAPISEPVAIEPHAEGHVAWWHQLPRPTPARPRYGAPVGVMTITGKDARGFVYLTQSDPHGLTYWPDICPVTADEAQRLAHALLAAAQIARREQDAQDSVVTTFRRKGAHQ